MSAYRGVASVSIVCPKPKRPVCALHLLMSNLEMGASPASGVDFEEDWSLPSSERSLGNSLNGGSSRRGSVSCSPYTVSDKCSKEVAREQRLMRNVSSLSYSGTVGGGVAEAGDVAYMYPVRPVSPPARSMNPVAMDSRFRDSDDFVVASGLAMDSGDIFEFSPSERFLLSHRR
eukprot:TRINITY_DN681_c0_g1_i1.p1 TRINITY_DN681_c0_g1~~TRINITY_DN681_c0_g1_i1.p1  ORF type:complete len:174 (-),score=51.89 TRINITY_DN681_c0_g1_i1:125-646(-)